MRRNQAVELSLNGLVEQLDELFFERATRAFRVASGIQRDMPAVPELPELVRADAWQVVNEVVSSPRVDEAKRGRLELLRRHVARAFVEAAVREQTERVDQFWNAQTFFSTAKTWTPSEAKRELPRMATREGRVTLQADSSSQLEEKESLAARRFDSALESMATGLKLEGVAFVEALQGRPVKERLEAIAATLKATDDAHLDLLGFALKKLDPMLTPRVATEHDASRAAMAPWLIENFRKEDLTHAVSRCLGDLGLSLNADGRLTIDQESRPGRSTEAKCFELRVPDQVRLLLTAESGLESWAGWLSTWGVGVHRAHVGRTLPFVERRLGDRSVVDAVGVLFETFLLDEGWLKRYLRLTAHQAREAARIAAFRQLHQARRAMALASYSIEAMKNGSTAPLGDDYRSRLANALGVEVPRGEALFAVDLFGDVLLKVDAFALEHTWRAHLRERFNEDFWRNPATGRWLVDLAARGQREDAVTHAKQLGAAGLQLTEAAQHRVAVMGA